MAQAKRAVEALYVEGVGLHLDGSPTSILRASGSGVHSGWTLTETPTGVLAEKNKVAKLVPWSRVRQLDYADA